MTDKKELAVTELLKPRYKVIAPFPNMEEDYGCMVGQILKIDKPIITGLLGRRFIPSSGFLDDYPHLFKKLEWWEERKPEEMPEYVRVVKNAGGFGLSDNCVRSVTEWRMNYNPPRADCFPILINAICLLPATEAEYLAFINNQTPTK